MSLRRVSCLLLPPVVVAAWRRLARMWRGDPGQQFVRRGAVPWSKGYFAHRAALVARALDDDEFMALFRESNELPPGYGIGLDERVVEYPWLISRLGPPRPGAGDERRIEHCLDAGSALNHDFLVQRPELTCRDLHVVTLAPEANCFWRQSISYLFGDLRDLPFRDAYYDVVVSISTLEHVGHDNFLFAEAVGYEPGGGFEEAVRELWRVLRPGGRLLMTVPYGRRQTFPSFQQFDAELLDRLVSALPASAVAHVERTFFRYDSAGWNLATPAACAEAEYEPWIMTAPEQRGPFPSHSDCAAAARAVACLLIEKSA